MCHIIKQSKSKQLSHYYDSAWFQPTKSHLDYVDTVFVVLCVCVQTLVNTEV